jgi:hypothetical protein
MKPLIDADVLRYEVGFSGQIKDEEGNDVFLDFDRVAELLDDKIKLICNEVGATEPPTLYLSADAFLIKELNRRRKLAGEEPLELKPNFREEIAVTKKYKGNRVSNKPFHFKNLSAYMLTNYDCVVANGIEADDAMCTRQYDNWEYINLFDKVATPTIICSRDKDLRICPGWHYSWECGKQAAIGPVLVDELGYLEKRPDGKVLGYGLAFFYYQLLVGDTVDNIAGVPGCGPVKAFKLLSGLTTEEEMYKAVVAKYQEAFPEDWKVHIREMANLLWMVREMNEDGSPVLYKPLKV